MKERLLTLLKHGSLSSGMLACRNEGERIYLKRFLAPAAVKPLADGADMPADTGECTRCPGAVDRKRPFGTGSSGVMIVLNAPKLSGRMEIEFYRSDSAGLLKKMTSAIGLGLNECYVTNLVKCDTSDSLVKPSEMVNNCLPMLKGEIEKVKPRIVIVMGELVPLRQIINASRGISWFNTEHCISLIKNPDLKRPAWETLKMVRKKLQELRNGD